MSRSLTRKLSLIGLLTGSLIGVGCSSDSSTESQLSVVSVGILEPTAGVTLPTYTSGTMEITNMVTGEVAANVSLSPDAVGTDATAKVAYGDYFIELKYYDESSNVIMETCDPSEKHGIYQATYAVSVAVCLPNDPEPVAWPEGESDVRIDAQAQNSYRVVLLADSDLYDSSFIPETRAWFADREQFQVTEITDVETADWSTVLDGAKILYIPPFYYTSNARFENNEEIKAALLAFTTAGGRIVFSYQTGLGAFLEYVYDYDADFFTSGSDSSFEKTAAADAISLFDDGAESLGYVSYMGSIKKDKADESGVVLPLYESDTDYGAAQIRVPGSGVVYFFGYSLNDYRASSSDTDLPGWNLLLEKMLIGK